MQPTAETIQPIVLISVAVLATCVVFTRDPRAQAIVLSAYGLLMGLLMLVLHAPDVALSQFAIGAAIVPLIIVLAIATCEREGHAARAARAESSGSEQHDAVPEGERT